MTSAAAFIAGIFTALLGIPAMAAVGLFFAILWRLPGRLA